MKLRTLMILGTLSLFPLQAMAADAPAAAAPAAAPAAPAHNDYWSKLDPTGKGYLTEDEWVANAKTRFKEIDTNGDGKVTKDELDAYHKKMMSLRMEKRKAGKEKKQQ